MKLIEDGHYITGIRITMKNKINIIALSYYRTGSNYNAQYKELQKCITSIKKKYYASGYSNFMMICGDFNAKNRLWYSSKNTPQGNHLQKLFVNNNLHSINKNTFTHRHYDKSCDVLDLTVVTPELDPLIGDWHVHNQVTDWCGNTDDHFCITFNIKNKFILRPRKKLPKWDILNANWKKYRSQLNKNMIKLDTIIRECKIDDNCDVIDQLVEILQWAYIDAAMETLTIVQDSITYELEQDEKIQDYLNTKKQISKKIKELKKEYNLENNNLRITKLKKLRNSKNNIQRKIIKSLKGLN